MDFRATSGRLIEVLVAGLLQALQALGNLEASQFLPAVHGIVGCGVGCPVNERGLIDALGQDGGHAWYPVSLGVHVVMGGLAKGNLVHSPCWCCESHFFSPVLCCVLEIFGAFKCAFARSIGVRPPQTP